MLLSREDSAAIRVARVLCIFFMMMVHVPPASSAASVLTSSLPMLHDVLVNFLGRSSVAALSFVSGYLLLASMSKRSASSILRSRFQSLVVPMWTWNAIFVVMAIVAFNLGHQAGAVRELFTSRDGDLLNLLTGLAGPTLNISLGFLRDLFAASVILVLGFRFVSKRPFATLAVLAVIVIADAAEPLVLRPSILLFMAAGSFAYYYGVKLSTLAKPSVSIPASAFCFVAAYYVDEYGFPSEVPNILLRAGLTFVVLGVSAGLVSTKLGHAASKIEPAIYVVYLSHVPVFSIIWVIWEGLGGTVTHVSYIAVFFLMPLAAIATGFAISQFTRFAPEPIGLLLTGKKSSGPKAEAVAIKGA